MKVERGMGRAVLCMTGSSVAMRENGLGGCACALGGSGPGAESWFRGEAVLCGRSWGRFYDGESQTLSC